MYMEAKNKYSQILYNATSLLIVMLSAHEINFIPLTASGAEKPPSDFHWWLT